MILYGKLIKGTKITREAFVEKNNDPRSFHALLEESLIDLCRDLDIPVPLWLEKNTHEFAQFRRTFFSYEQFLDKVAFDRFEIML